MLHTCIAACRALNCCRPDAAAATCYWQNPGEPPCIQGHGAVQGASAVCCWGAVPVAGGALQDKESADAYAWNTAVARLLPLDRQGR